MALKKHISNFLLKCSVDLTFDKWFDKNGLTNTKFNLKKSILPNLVEGWFDKIQII
jgi:hypothetical protein